MNSIHQLENVNKVIIFCGYKEKYLELKKKFSKIEAVCDEHNEALKYIEQEFTIKEHSIVLGSCKALEKTK